MIGDSCALDGGSFGRSAKKSAVPPPMAATPTNVQKIGLEKTDPP